MSNCNALYNETNNHLNNIIIKLSSLIQNQGYKTVALPKAGRIKDGIFFSALAMIFPIVTSMF